MGVVSGIIVGTDSSVFQMVEPHELFTTANGIRDRGWHVDPPDARHHSGDCRRNQRLAACRGQLIILGFSIILRGISTTPVDVREERRLVEIFDPEPVTAG